MSGQNGNGKVGLLSRLMKGKRAPDVAYHPILLDASQFQWALERERARAERFSTEFVLVRMQVTAKRNGSNGHNGRNGHNGHIGSHGQNGFLSHLGAVVGDRLRQSDLAGLSGEGISMVLPDMPEGAVERLVEDIERLFHERVAKHYGKSSKPPELSCEIFHSIN